MVKTTTWNSKYFYGHRISNDGLVNGYLDYGTLSKAFDAVLVNDITKLFYSTVNGEYIEPEQINGIIDYSDEIEELRDKIDELMLDNDDDQYTDYIDALQDKINELEEMQEPDEIFQYYIISGNGAEILQEFTNDPVYYIDMLDMYIWGVTHWGTAWDYVSTGVKLEVSNDD